MKSKVLFAVLFATYMIIVASGCGTTKNGCPTSQDGNPRYKFRG